MEINGVRPQRNRKQKTLHGVNPPGGQAPVKCAKEDGGIFDEKYVAVKSYDFRAKTFQDGSNMVIIGEKKWGYNVKSILKYLFLRFFGREHFLTMMWWRLHLG